MWRDKGVFCYPYKTSKMRYFLSIDRVRTVRLKTQTLKTVEVFLYSLY